MTGLTIIGIAFVIGMAVLARYSARRHLRERDAARDAERVVATVQVDIDIYDDILRSRERSPLTARHAREDMEAVA